MATLADLLRQGSDKLISFSDALQGLPQQAQRFATNPQAFIQSATGQNFIPKETGFSAGFQGLTSQNPVSGGVLNPQATPYTEGYESAEPVGIAAMAVPGYAQVLRAGAPKAYNALENYMVKTGGIQPMIAYHGTPHNIQGGFDIKKVGTGEGAQVYGHGMYFAEAPKVATQYANELGTKIDVNGKPLMQQGKIVGSTGNVELDDFLVANLGDVKATRKDLLQSIKEVRPTNPEGVKDYQKLLADLRKSNVNTANTGNLYKVDIPDADISMMLNWDKPFTEQNKLVQDAIKQIEPKIKQINPDLNVENLNGQGIYKAYQEYRGNNPDFASEGLNELGIKGIRYLDEGSRSAGKGTSNFVVFEPSTVKILEKNDIPVSRKELLEQQLNKLE